MKNKQISQSNNPRGSFGLPVSIISFVTHMSFRPKRQCKFLPVERGRAGRSGRGATASLKGDRLCEAAMELEGGILEPGTGERTEGWRGRIGGDKAPLCLFSKYTFSPTLEIQRGNICLHNRWAAQVLPICLFLVCRSH